MTYCNTLADPIKKKVVRIIKELLGKQYLIDHAQTLGYDPSKAVRKKGTSCELKQKIVSEEDRENQAKPQSPDRGTKVSETQTCEEKAITQGDPRKNMYNLREEASPSDPGNGQAPEYVSVDASVHAIIVKELRGLLSQYGLNEFMAAFVVIVNEIETSVEEKADSDSTGSEKGDI